MNNLIKHRYNKIDKYKRTSKVWNYFSIIDKYNTAKCKMCKSILSYKSSIHNLKRHLQRRHKIATVTESRRINGNSQINVPDGDFASMEYITDETDDTEYSNDDDDDFDESNNAGVKHDWKNYSGDSQTKKNFKHKNEMEIKITSKKNSENSTNNAAAINGNSSKFTNQIDMGKNCNPDHTEQIILNDIINKYKELPEFKFEPSQHPLDKFFTAMYEMTQHLPTNLQLRVKRQLFKTVTDAEENVLQRSTNNSEISSVNKKNFDYKGIIIDSSKKIDTRGLDKFFSCMCEMSIPLPPVQQLQIKKKLFDVVVEAEEEYCKQLLGISPNNESITNFQDLDLHPMTNSNFIYNSIQATTIAPPTFNFQESDILHNNNYNLSII